METKKTNPEEPAEQSVQTKRSRGFDYLQKGVTGVLLISTIFVLLNSGFFIKNIAFLFEGPKDEVPVVENTSANVNTEQPQIVKGEPNTLSIESLNITAPLQYVTQINESVFQDALKDGVVHYPGTAMPGQPGNSYYFGHSSDYPWSGGQYKSVFALLPQIANEALIKITDADGQLYTYKVIRQAVIAADDTSVLSQGDDKEKLLTLQTSYPVGTALKRYIVVGKLVKSPQ